MFSYVVPLFMALLALGCGNYEEGEADWGPLSAGLQCKLVTERSEYVLGQPIVIEIHIKNRTDKQVIIYQSPSREETVFIRYEGGTSKSKTDRVEYDPPPSSGKQLFLIIPAGADVRYMTPEYGRDYFDRPGRWEMRSTYVFEYVDKPVWTGKLKSNLLRLNILPDK